LEYQQGQAALLQEVDSGARRTSGVDVTKEIAERTSMLYRFSAAFEELGQRIQGGGPALQGQSVLSRLPILKSRVLKFEKQSTYWEPKRYLPKTWPIMRRRLADVSHRCWNWTRTVRGLWSTTCTLKVADLKAFAGSS